MEKEIQKSAFIVSYMMYEFKEGEGMKKQREFPLLVIVKVAEMMDFLCRYTKFADYHNNDHLQMRQELKNAVWSIDISEMELLEKEILMDDRYGLHEFDKEYYPNHCIHVHRVPLGVHKKNFNRDFIQ